MSATLTEIESGQFGWSPSDVNPSNGLHLGGPFLPCPPPVPLASISPALPFSSPEPSPSPLPLLHSSWQVRLHQPLLLWVAGQSYLLSWPGALEISLGVGRGCWGLQPPTAVHSRKVVGRIQEPKATPPLPSLAVCPWAAHITSLCLGSLTCAMKE